MRCTQGSPRRLAAWRGGRPGMKGKKVWVGASPKAPRGDFFKEGETVRENTFPFVEERETESTGRIFCTAIGIEKTKQMKEGNQAFTRKQTKKQQPKPNNGSSEKDSHQGLIRKERDNFLEYKNSHYHHPPQLRHSATEDPLLPESRSSPCPPRPR